jgi:anaerobic magnesium-protoporphyrin IX monomethyl ester cyclase
MRANDLRYLLINVPLTDPTSPYHSISYLVGATVAAGYSNVICLDANIEALNFLAQPNQVSQLLKDASGIRAGLERRARLTRGQQLAYRYALKALGLEPDSVTHAIGVLRDPEAFYDYGLYRQAVLVLKRWMDVLSVRGFPGQFEDFGLRLRDFGNLSSVADLTNTAFLNRLVAPFAAYFDGPFVKALGRSEPEFVGLSVNYISQLPFAIDLCKRIRALLPDVVLCVGGTEVSDDVKYARDPADVWRLFGECDVIVAGEGETAILDILGSIADGRPLPYDRPGVLRRDGSVPQAMPGVNFESLATLPRPRYDIWDLSQYWSPEPVLLYSPSRGCYWNKCTFCDYGLNTNLPTSPSRNRPIEMAIEELKELTNLSRTVYFSVDAIAPAHLRKLARAIVEHDIHIRWSAELRLEKTFLRDMAQDLKDSGCVSVSFGYESGSQRILDLINKGVRLTDVPDLLKELGRVGIGAQMMGFIGFPGEQPDEAYATYAFLRDHIDDWTLAGIGDFVMTPGAIVAKRPADFGIHATRSIPGDDIVRMLCWIDAEGNVHGPGDMRSPEVEGIAQQIARPVDDRPFVGGIDTAHSMLYFARYGPALIPQDRGDPTRSLVKTVLYRTPLTGVDDFARRADIEAFHRARLVRGEAVTFGDIQAWLDEYPTGPSETVGVEADVLEIYPSGHFVTLTPERAAFEQEASPAYQLAKALLLRASGVQ